MFNEKDIQQIRQHGLTPSEVTRQIEFFKNGMRSPEIEAPATPEKGIKCLNDNQIDEFVNFFDKERKNLKVVKFVPASGAATRMFKSLQAFRHLNLSPEEQKRKLSEETAFDSTGNFIRHIRNFAFYSDLKKVLENQGFNLESLIEEGNINLILDYLLEEKGLGYASKPKALIKFHDYGDFQRTALGEHLAESALYAVSGDGKCYLHFTVSAEHLQNIQQLVERVKPYYENFYHRKFEVAFSIQDPATDTIAVDMENKPFRDEEGNLVFRPGGHGALIKNLNKIRADLIFVKNIDNVVPDSLKTSTIRYKKLLAGHLLYLQERIFSFLDRLDHGDLTENFLKTVKRFMQKELMMTFPDYYSLKDMVEKAEFLFIKLNRPLRVCGMVKNVGEPGGGPFYVKNHEDEMIELQILESSQFDMTDPDHQRIFHAATHFNPVDMVLGVYDFRGRKFRLDDFVDPDTAFITIKSKDGRELKALELPGLWNGAMADWNTVFIEVPLNTFNPVKVVNDLLREQHQGR